MKEAEIGVSVLDPDWIRIQEGKITHKNRKKSYKNLFLKCYMFSLVG
jgi:hypothetical protein